MSTTPPEPQRQTMGMPSIPSGARMPVPGNAEFLLYAVIEIALILIWIIADSVNTDRWCVFTVILTAFYILSRGIAKASRVLEQ